MYIKSVDLTNFRGASSLKVELDQHLNVLVGANGSGKSTVLDAIAIMLSWAISRIRQARTSGKPIPEDDIKNNKQWASIEVTCQHGEQSFSWRLVKSRRGFPTPQNGSNFVQLSEYTKDIQGQIDSDTEWAKIPLFAHYSVNRAVLDIPLRIRNRHRFDLLGAYDDALTGGGGNFRAFFEWFREREDLENELRRDKPDACLDSQLEAVRLALKDILPDFQNLRVRRNPLRMEIEKRGNTFRVAQLSGGEKCLIALISDLARRLAIANPEGQPLKGQGIILIDEIDLHLHPQWQRMIIPKLKEVFSSCQFIISTHSPHILNNVQPENIFSLAQTPENIFIEKPSESYGKNVDRVLEDLMGLPTTRPDIISEKLHKVFESIDTKNLDQARQEIDELKKTIGNDPELVKAAVLLKRKELIGK